MTETRNTKTVLKFLKKSMRKHGQPDIVVMDRLQSYGAALEEIGAALRQATGRWLNSRTENSHLPFGRRERAMLPFRRMRSLQEFAAVHASIYHLFNLERSRHSRPNFELNRTATLSAAYRTLRKAKPLCLPWTTKTTRASYHTCLKLNGGCDETVSSSRST